LSALASFALIAPFLKILHELGHVLTATRFGVTVRNAGLYLISLYPMPFVDCSDADISASRNQRIAISLAGLFVDLTVALIALVLWHFADGGFGKTLLGRIFVFSSINSVVFNANPLIRLDGYFALSDWLGRRNLSTAATKRFKSARRYMTTFGREGIWPKTGEDYALCGFAFGSALYRINILITIAWLMLPRFFGLGVILIVWAGYLMFLSPMLAAPKAAAAPKASRGKSWPFWMLFTAIFAAALVFVTWPVRVVLPVSPDITNHYAIVAKERGILVSLGQSGVVEKGDVIALMENSLLDQELILQNEELAFLGLALDSVSGFDPTQAMALNDRMTQAQSLSDALAARQGGLEITSPSDGYFSAPPEHERDVRLSEGSEIGYLYPLDGVTHLAGQFPERLVDRFNQVQPTYVLRTDATYQADTAVTEGRVVQLSRENLETGERSFKIEVIVDQPANDFRLAETYLMVGLGSEPLYRHLQLAFEGVRQKYWNARSSQ